MTRPLLCFFFLVAAACLSFSSAVSVHHGAHEKNLWRAFGNLRIERRTFHLLVQVL